MGIFLGYLSLLCFILLIVKILTRKLRLVKVDTVLRKLHKPLCCVLAASCVLHVLFVIPVFKTRNLLIYITGLLMILLLAVMIIFCHVKRKDAAKWLHWHRILAGLMLLCVVGHIAIYTIDFRDYQARIRTIQLQGVDAGDLADGTYSCEYDAGYIYAKVDVQISNGAIQSIILLEHEHERGQAAEKVIPNIVATKTFPVDAIAGATNSSKVIQNAVQNALERAAAKN